MICIIHFNITIFKVEITHLHFKKLLQFSIEIASNNRMVLLNDKLILMKK